MDAATNTPTASAERMKGRSVFLLVSLLLFILLVPYVEGHHATEGILGIFYSLVMLASVYAVSDRRSHWILALALGLPGLVESVIYAFGVNFLVLDRYGSFHLLPFHLYTTWLLLRSTLETRVVTKDTISGAVCVYLLIGMTWSLFYGLLVAFQPNAFHLATVPAGQGTPDWTDLLYYSFVTLLTVGYGDITPATRHARSLSVLEALVGILFIAVLISRLVSLYRTPSDHER